MHSLTYTFTFTYIISQRNVLNTEEMAIISRGGDVASEMKGRNRKRMVRKR